MKVVPYLLALGILSGACSGARDIAGPAQTETRAVQKTSPQRNDGISPNAAVYGSSDHEVNVYSYRVRSGDSIERIIRREARNSKFFREERGDEGYAKSSGIGTWEKNIVMTGPEGQYLFDIKDVFFEANQDLYKTLSETCPDFDACALKIGQTVAVPDLGNDEKINGRRGKLVGKLRFEGTSYNEPRTRMYNTSQVKKNMTFTRY